MHFVNFLENGNDHNDLYHRCGKAVMHSRNTQITISQIFDRVIIKLYHKTFTIVKSRLNEKRLQLLYSINEFLGVLLLMLGIKCLLD